MSCGETGVGAQRPAERRESEPVNPVPKLRDVEGWSKNVFYVANAVSTFGGGRR